MTRLADLKGRKVGAWGGSFVTAQHIRRATEIEFKIVEFSDETAALKALSDKSVDALISVAGSPQPWIQRLDRKFRLIPIADAELARLKGEYGTARLSYGNLGQTGVSTVATDAVLVVQDYRTVEYSAMLAQVRSCFRNRLSELQETRGNASSWHRVDLDAKVNWPLYVEPAKSTASTSRSIRSR